MMCELENRRREKLQEAVKTAALELFGETGASAFLFPLDGKQGCLFIAAGTMESIRSLLPPARQT